ncbi:MAG: hypothetical protein ACLU3I_15770 [Acutalibacteraceae bacterium]
MLAAISGVSDGDRDPAVLRPAILQARFQRAAGADLRVLRSGRLSGVVCEFLKVLIHLLLKGTSTAFVGDLANFLVGCSFVLPAAIVYQKTAEQEGRGRRRSGGRHGR